MCPSDALNVLPSSGTTAFAVLQSALAEIHIRRNSSTLKSDLRFSPNFALAGFPFPWPSGWSENHDGPYPLPATDAAQALLDSAANRLTETRNKLLTDPETLLPEVHPVPSGWGPTELYNRYDDGAFVSPGIEPLREAHVQLLDAVLGAYAADASLQTAAPLFAVLRADMQVAENRGWCFDHPWIDGTERYVPTPEFRRRIIEALLEANVDRWTQEVDLIALKVNEAVANDAALARKLRKGVGGKGLISALKKHSIKIHVDDAEHVLKAGVKSGTWTRVGVLYQYGAEEDSVFSILGN